ncbi:MAG: hypothetical protein U1F59_05960 [Candidatus Competibacteraceae bacterium]
MTTPPYRGLRWRICGVTRRTAVTRRTVVTRAYSRYALAQHDPPPIGDDREEVGRYTDGQKAIPIKRHRQFDRITANELCKQAGLAPKF